MSDEVLVSGTRTYSVGKKVPVYLSVTIGDGQSGGSSILWEGNILAEGVINKFPIGKEGDNLQYKTLRVTTKVKDVNPSTNKTSVTFLLENGDKNQSFPFEIEASESGYAVYSITFVFV